MTGIRSVAVKQWSILSENLGLLIVTPRIMFGLHITKREVIELIQLHHLYTDHLTIRSELKC
jgi:hypothetical protein